MNCFSLSFIPLKSMNNIILIISLQFISMLTFIDALKSGDDSGIEKVDKAMSVFNVVTFPNSACGSSSGYNGTCFTASECTAKGGTSSGSCASSFGVCCVFTLSCGGTSSSNNSYAIISSYSTTSDADPCTYTFCRMNSDVCKLRIDFETLVIADPETMTAPNQATTDGPRYEFRIYLLNFSTISS